MDNNIEAKIETRKKQIWESLKAYVGTPVLFEEYRFPELEIIAFTPNPDEHNRGLAKILVSLKKDPALRVRRELNPDGSVHAEKLIPFDNLGEYWLKGTANMLNHPQITLSEKAYMLLQLKENVERIYSAEHSAEVKKTNILIDNLISDLNIESVNTKEESRFSVGMNRTKSNIPELNDAQNINVINFFRNLFFNKKTYEQIKRATDKEFKIELVSEIEYQKGK